VRSPFARAAIRGIDPSAALDVPGARAVLTAADLNIDMKEQWHTSMGPDGPETPRPPLAEGEARFAGDPVALVVAESRYTAEDAADLVDVDYDPLTPVVDYRQAEEAGELVHEAHGSNLIGELAGAPASLLDDAFAGAAHVVSETIFQQRYAAVPKVAARLRWVAAARENRRAAGSARHEHADVAMAFDDDGVIQAVRIDHIQDCGAYPTPWPVMTAAAVGAIFPGPYRVPKSSFTTKTIYTNTAGRAPYRGPWQFETLAREVLLDIAARRIGIDPADLRRRNMLSRDELP